MPKSHVHRQSISTKTEQNSLIVLGIDTGPDQHAYVLLRFDHSHSIAFVELGMADTPTLGGLERTYTFAALERPAGFAYKPAIVCALLKTAYEAGCVCGQLQARGVPVVPLCAADWRRDVCGNGSATDAVIKDAVTRLVRGWPKRSNAHHRDAAGVALAAGWLRLREQGGSMGEATQKDKARELATGGMP